MKLILTLFAAIILFTVNLNAQSVLWDNAIGGAGADRGTCIQQTRDRGFIVCGNSESDISGDKTENSRGSSDVWLVKTDPEGQVQWQKTIGGNDADLANYVSQTDDNGYIIAAQSSSGISGEKTDSCRGLQDYWIIKTDAAGNIQWQRTLGGDDYEYLSKVIQTPDGGYIAAGHSISEATGDKTENSNGFYDFWLIKLDASGNIEWQNTIGGSLGEELRSIDVTTDGGYILGGGSGSPISGDKTENSTGNDCWIVKVDAAGNIMWQNTIGGNLHEVITDVHQTADGGYIIGGHSSSGISGDKTEINYGIWDYWVLKLDPTGNIQWQNTIGGSDSDLLNSVIVTQHGDYLVSGQSASGISGKKSEPNYGMDDYWVLLLDHFGTVIWQKTCGGLSSEQWNVAIESHDHSIVLAGTSSSPVSGTKTDPGNGSTDYWILRLNSTYNSITGLYFIDTNANQVQDAGEPVLPNKVITELTTGNITLSNSQGQYTMAVFDTGNFVVEAPYLNYHISVPLQHNASFTALNQADSLNNFAAQPQGNINDLSVVVTPASFFRPGFPAMCYLQYQNTGTTTISNCSVVFYPDNNMTFTGSGLPEAFITADSIGWNLSNISPFQSGSIPVHLYTPPGVPIGTVTYTSAIINPVPGDFSPPNNYYTIEVPVSGAVDPNAKYVNPGTITTTQLATAPYLEYTVFFQNTGTDTAFTVVVEDEMAQELDILSFEFLAASHPADISINNFTRTFSFRFDNILLPDSNTNEPLSHGFIKYRIKPLVSLQAGSLVQNYADIFFDFNDPVRTNTTTTEIILPSFIFGITSENTGLIISPNPVSDYMEFRWPSENNLVTSIEIFNAMGKVLEKFEVNARTSGMNSAGYYTGKMGSGVYLLRIRNGNKIISTRFVKM